MTPNKTLHRTAIPLRSIAAGELMRYVAPAWKPSMPAEDSRPAWRVHESVETRF